MTQKNHLERYNKLFISLRYFLIGAAKFNQDYSIALKALEFAKEIHTGLRKDNVTPEFQHQIEIAHFVRTFLPSLTYPAQTIATCILHDVAEDYDVSFDEIEQRFGSLVRNSTFLLTKKYRGATKTPTEYFSQIVNCPISSVVKAADRINNQQSMTGVFLPEKQQAYLNETKQYILPMIKKARHLHVEQEAIYENLKFVLNAQQSLIEIALKQSNLCNPQPTSN